MKTITKKDIEVLFGQIKKNYRFKTEAYDDPELKTIWFNALKDYPQLMLKYCAAELFATSTYPPNLANLLSIFRRAERAIEPTSHEVWNEFIKVKDRIISINESICDAKQNWSYSDRRPYFKRIEAERDTLFNSLPVVIKLFLGDVKNLTYEFNQALVLKESQFYNSFERLTDRAKLLGLIKNNIKALTEKCQSHLLEKK